MNLPRRWQKFGSHTLKEYHDIYLKTDVLILADIFENVRNTCVGAYGLDPAHYLSAAGLSWDAMLKITDIQLELFSDANMLSFLEKGLRGGF